MNLKGQCEPFKHNVMKRDFWIPKNLVTCTRILVIPRSRPRNVRGAYVHIKLQKDTHHLWAERKRMLRLKSDDELTCAPTILVYSSRTPALTGSEEFSVSTIRISKSVRDVPFLSSHAHNDVNI